MASMDRRRFLLALGATCAPVALHAQPQVNGASPRHVVALGAPGLSLGGVPTPITSHPALARELGLASLSVKRDDQAGAPFGGSKARKLEAVLHDAMSRGHRAVLTFGGVGSNHALATAVHAARCGLDCHLVLLHEPPSAHARAHLLAEVRAGAVLHAGTRADRDDPAGAVARLFPGRPAPYVIPMGGTSPLGNLGYVACAREIADEVARSAVAAPDAVFVATGTTGTAAGLLFGLRHHGLDARLIAVRVSGPRTASRARVLDEVDAMVAAAARVQGAQDPGAARRMVDDARFVLDPRFSAPGYARSDAGLERLIARGAEHGIPLDATYTAKAFRALAAYAPALRGRHVMFVDTYDPRVMPIDGVTPADLPPALRGYATFTAGVGRR